MSKTMRRTTHRLSIDAPGELIFRMLRDSSHWPYLDGLTVYSERVSGDDTSHELRTSVVSNGSLCSTHCHRIFHDAELQADFRQLGLEAPLLLEQHLGSTAAPATVPGTAVPSVPDAGAPVVAWEA